MTTFPTEEQPALAADAASQRSRSPRRSPTAAPQKPRVAPAKGEGGEEGQRRQESAQSRQQSAKAAKAAKGEEARSAREGSKTAKVLDLLKRPDGATLKEIMKATGWQPHSVRGFISGTLGKKMGLVVVSAKGEDGERVYSLPK